MSKRLRFFLATILLLSSLVSPNSGVFADPSNEFYATPSAAMPGASVVFSGFGFAPNSTIDLYLATLPSQFLGSLPTSSTGEVSGALVLPAVAPGAYQVMAAPNDIFTPLTVLPAVNIVLLPESGPPATLVHFTVENLLPGRLRLDYAGTPVYGPVDVPGGTFEGDFLVPSDRPVPLGTDAEVRAVNLVGSQVVGSAQTFFFSQPPNPSPYTFQNVEMPSAPVQPGQTFSISGQISPPPAGPLALYSLKVLWKSATGQVAPISIGTPQLLADGSFTASARVPSLLAGDPLVPAAGGQVGLVFYDQSVQSKSVVSNIGWGLDPPDPVFIVKVVDSGGNPIQGALVDVRAFYSDFKQLSGKTTGGVALQNLVSDLPAHPNQVTAYLGSQGVTESDPFTCEQTNVYGRTNAQGEFAVQFDPAMLAMMGEKIFLGNLPAPTYAEVPLEITFPLYVNALHQGYGTLAGQQPVPYERKIRFSGVTNQFFDAQTSQLLVTNPLVVSLPALPPGATVSVPIVPKVIGGGAPVGGFKNYLGTGIPMSAFGKFYSFPASQFPDAWFATFSGKDLKIEFQHDQALFGQLDEANLKFTLLGQTYLFENKGLKYTGVPGCNAVVYQATIPNFHRIAAGFHTGLIEIRDTSVPAKITRHYIQLNYVPAPTWILDAKFQERSVYIDPLNGSIVLEGSQYPAGGTNSASSLDTNVPKVGPMQNRTGYQDEVVEIVYPDHTSGILYRSQVDTTALDETAAPQKFNDAVAGGKSLPLGPESLKILDTGKIPLFRDVFGIWPIASATIGADMWFDANLTYDGQVQFLASGGTQTTLLVTPDATVGVDAWLDLSAILGLISANAHAVPQITLKMPARFIDGTLDDSKKCFLYKLDINWSAKAGVCPFCAKKSGTRNIFNGANPNPCTLAPGSLNTLAVQAAVETPQPPSANPALAVDGYGHTLLLWSDEAGNIQSRVLSGGQIVANLPVTGSGGSLDPQVAFYAPNKAAAVWTESSLTAQQSSTATLDQIVQAQHLRYALWDGTAWSAPQNLTLPADSSGEGGVALAGCLSTRPGCPASGAVTAVWVRDAHPSGDLAARQFRLFYATMTNGSWSAPQAVDPGSTATDSDPTVTYQSSGIPLVAWVRDADRDLGSLGDRRLAYRSLSGGQPVNVDAALPVGVVEPSLALNAQDEMMLAFTVAVDPQALIGNQRQLFAAQRTCSGACAWNYQALVDANGRPVHAESPVLSVNTAGQALVTYRALGYGEEFPGGAKVMMGDALGTILGTGEIAQAFVNFASNTIAPTFLTNAGKTLWQTAAVYDPLLNQVYAVSSQGSGPALPQPVAAWLEGQGYSLEEMAADEEVALVTSSALADLSVYSVTPSSLTIQPGGEPLSVTVMLLNNGGEFRSSISLRLTWDAPAGLGTPAGQAEIRSMGAGTFTGIEFSPLELPAFPHLPHTLYVEVNAEQSVQESRFDNNRKTVAIGGLPAPLDLTAVARSNSSAVFLQWAPAEHEAIVGYRIYRTQDGRIYTPVGSSFGFGFVDLSAVAGQSYAYRVAAYAADGFESAPSESVRVVVAEEYPVYLPLVRR